MSTAIFDLFTVIDKIPYWKNCTFQHDNMPKQPVVLNRAISAYNIMITMKE